MSIPAAIVFSNKNPTAMGGSVNKEFLNLLRSIEAEGETVKDDLENSRKIFQAKEREAQAKIEQITGAYNALRYKQDTELANLIKEFTGTAPTWCVKDILNSELVISFPLPNKEVYTLLDFLCTKLKDDIKSIGEKDTVPETMKVVFKIEKRQIVIEQIKEVIKTKSLESGNTASYIKKNPPM